MEAALLGGTIKAILPKLLSLVGDKYKLRSGVKAEIQSLENELRMIVGSIDDDASRPGDGGSHDAVRLLLVEDLRVLAYGIEDCIDSYMYRTLRKKQSSLLRRGARFPKTVLEDLQLAEQMQQLKKQAVEVLKRRQWFFTAPGQQISPAAPARQDEPKWPVFDPRSVCDADLVGTAGPLAELRRQLADDEGRLKVIAIVGFSGLGKSALAAQVYNGEIRSGRFEQHAWVCAAEKLPMEEVLTSLLRKLTADSSGSSSQGTSEPEVGQLCQDIRKQLHKKRYIIVIDDIQTKGLWENIKQAFPDNNGITSRIVVTTTIQSVANACSSGKGYVHNMGRLGDTCSEKLFFMKACPEKKLCFEQRNSAASPEKLCFEQRNSAAILKKCDGLPLALVTVGEFLQARDWMKGPACEDICSKIHYHLKNDGTFDAMRRVLLRNYTSLPGHALKACLLYFGMFPSDYQIKRKRLLRRWLAEGFVESQPSTSTPDPTTAFDELKDRNIIEPIYVSNNENVKTCQTYSMMHEFILHMSISQNFITLLCDEMVEPRYARRLSLHKSLATDGMNLDTNVLCLVRSLTVFGKASEGILDFSKYQLLRLLDLEKCDDELNDDHLKNIFKLLLLKYLSLGKTVTKLPRDVAKLKVLEVLDLRASEVNILPAEVFQMPCLIHLFGRFRFPDEVMQNSEVMSKGKCKLQTLAGFIADGREGYLNLFGYMKNLSKVKVWCESLADRGSTKWTDLQEAIQLFIQDKNAANIGPRSLSLHFGKCFGNSLSSLKGPVYLSSLKLHGELHALPQFVSLLRGLEELCLQSVKLEKGLLVALTELTFLKYLKLIADDLEEFIIKDQAFPKLLRICLVLQRPTFPIIQKRSMPDLKEVILDHQNTPEIRVKWEKVANEHPNKPKISWLKPAEGANMQPTEDYDASDPAIIECTGNSVASKESLQYIQNSTNYFVDFTRILCHRMPSGIHVHWRHGLFPPLLPTLRGLCFIVLVLCIIGFLLLVG